jgi:two-component system cell cycle response regulator
MTARVVVVDDLLPNLKLLEAKLTNEYMQVETAQSGADAQKQTRLISSCWV